MSRIYQALQKAGQPSRKNRNSSLTLPGPADHSSVVRLASFVRNEKKPLCICSCPSRAGASFVSGTLAEAAARSGSTVLIDLSEGGDLSRKFSIQKGPGFWDLAGNHKAEIKFHKQENLTVVGAGLESPSHADKRTLEAIASGELIGNGENSTVILDGGNWQKLTGLSRGLGIAVMTVIVVQPGLTRRKELHEAVAALSRSGFAVIGTVVNGG